MRMNTIMHSTGRVEHRNLDWKPKKRLVEVCACVCVWEKAELSSFQCGLHQEAGGDAENAQGESGIIDRQIT